MSDDNPPENNIEEGENEEEEEEEEVEQQPIVNEIPAEEQPIVTEIPAEDEPILGQEEEVKEDSNEPIGEETVEGGDENELHEGEEKTAEEVKPSESMSRPSRQVKLSVPADADDTDDEGGDDNDDDKLMKEGSKKKPKHSLSAHLQVEVNKQKLLRAKQAREDRRARLDTQHLYLLEQIASHIDLKVKEVEEFIIDSHVYIDLMDNFMEKKGRKSIIFVYQEADAPGTESGRPINTVKKERGLRLIVSDGTDVRLRGKVMYFVRPNSEIRLTMKNIPDETYFGILDLSDPEEPGVVLDSVVYNLNNLFIPYLETNGSWITVPDPDLAESIRHKFLTSIRHYAEFLADCKNDICSRLDLRQICDMDELVEKHLTTPEKVLEAAKNQELVFKAEHIVILWCKNIERVLALSKLMRKDTDAMGPNAELAYWRNLHAKMCFIIQQINQQQFINIIQVLVQSKSKVYRRWKDVDARVTDDYNESKDNVRYMYALSKFVEPLYQLDPQGMTKYVSSMIYTIHTIHTNSRYYNSCEKVTALLVKISNQMVYASRRYLTKDGSETIWNQEKRIMIEKLTKCLELYATYRGCYEDTKTALEQNPDGKQFNFSVNHIFGRYDLFCERLRKIISLLEIFDMYKFVHESHIDGIEVISLRLNNLFKNILKKSYDPLEFRQADFDKDFLTVRSSLDEIQKNLETFMDKSIESCSTAMHCLELLERFSNLRNRCLNIEEKQLYAFEFYHNEIIMLKGVYESEKNDTPIPRGFPPFAGKIAWARHLFMRLERPMLYFQEKTTILEREEARPTIQAYNGLAKKLVYYEIIFHDAFVKQSSSIYDSLEAPLLTLRNTLRPELVVNFDPFFRQIVDETEIIRKLNLEIPDIAQIVYFRQDKIFLTYEKMKHLLDKFLLVKGKIPADLIALIRPLVKRVEKSFMPGVSSINWTSFKCEEYFEFIGIHLDELESIGEKIDDIINIRINQNLHDITHTLMIDLPEEKPMGVQEYLEKIRTYGMVVAKDLEYKSRYCESAVIELINTLLATNDINVPDEIMFAWMNPTLFGKSADSKSTQSMIKQKESRKVKSKTKAEDQALTDLVSELTQAQREEVGHLHEECRHVFAFYSQKCIEALQKATRTSLDILRKRTEEPQVSKRNPGKTENRIPLFTGDLIVTIPSISLKPPIEESQLVLTKSVGIISDILKHIVIWGQTRRSSFDTTAEDSYFKEIKETPSVDLKVYERLQTQEAYVRASFQLSNLNSGLKNCQKPVMDYKDISKMILMMASVVTQAKPKITSIITKYTSSYSYLWKSDREDEIKALILDSPAITEIQATMRKYNELIDEINDIVPSHRIGPLEIFTNELKLGLIIEVKSWKQLLCKLLAEDYKVKTFNVFKFMEDINKDLAVEIKDLADIKFAMEALSKVRDRFVDDEALLTPIEECYAFLSSQNYKVTEEESSRADSLRYTFKNLQAKTLQVQDKICKLQEENNKKLLESISKFQVDLKKHLEKYRERGPMIEGLTPQDASDRLMIFQDEFDALFERYTLCNDGEKLFGYPPKEYPEMVKHQKELALLQKLYGLYNDVMRSIDGYYEIKWTDLDIQKIMAELGDFQTRCRRLPKALKDWPAYNVLKKKIDDFNETCPLLELMSDKSMKSRHWERIGDVTGYKFDLENENFSLRDVMGCPLLKFKDEVEDICIGAVKEKDIEAKMKQIVIDWSIVTLQFTSFKNRGEMLLKGQETADLMTQLEDALMILNFLSNNRYSTLYKKELLAHLADFSNTAQILENWLAVQNLWIYLEAVFVGGDIARQMPLEAKRFQNIDRTWVKIMNRARENPLVIPCCVGDETMGQLLPHLLEQLELCQKSLSGYLESKRKIFPRFFFISDPVLLEILGQASDSHSIQPHLLSLFENVNEIDWNAKEYNRMIGVISKEGEKIVFEDSKVAEGNVEIWLGTLLTTQQSSLLSIIRDSAYALNATDFELLEFLATYLAQVGLLGLQILWTRDAENALTNSKRDRRIMQQTNNKFLQILNTLISQTTKNLSKYERVKFETLITIHVHQRDIFDEIVKAHVKSPYDFEWLKQARFYFSFEQDACIVKITNITFKYCNEFLGCTDRLVITPLTDRCYITIGQAAGNSLGANPSGPAGTGKTETSKDMAKALGKYCVVFNCSDQMDFRGLGRIFKGLAQSGSWGCFDEFNRIELPVLSVAAQQIHIILQARRDAKEVFIFSDGDHVDLNPEFAVIITMNPGYAGRVELPENMKVQFRAISMIVPDKQIIIRVKLASCGFLENVILARKFFTLYSLCEQQLSKQVHYDFGLRNILAVLRTLGFQKRKRVNDAEETVIMAVLRDMNLSKLVDEDEGLFLSLIKDLFPGVVLDSVTHDELLRAIADEVGQAKLINHPSWNLKVIQFYETSLVRHGLMALGPTGAGKTQMMLILMRAYTQLGTPHKEVRMNPKAILASQMFGRLDVATNDWTDGIFSTIWRKALKVKKTEALWIVLDGPVDAVWIENLNSVLDDNKTLTLANGDRIVMGVNVKLVFEPDNVDNASPATVSRVGMVFMSASVLPWQPILQSWLLKRTKQENDTFGPLFDKIFSDLLGFIKINTSPKMVVQDSLLIRQAVDLLIGLIPSKDSQAQPSGGGGGDKKEKFVISAAHYERLFLFSLMWSVGALLELKDRSKMQEFVTTHESNLDWPKCGPDETVFEFVVGTNGQWEHWRNHLEEYIYPTDSIPQYANILVPNVDNIRTNYLIHLIAKEGKAVLLIGEQGTAKTVMINKYFESYNPETQMSKIINFSSETSPNLFQRIIESFVDKRMGTTYGPPRGRKMTIFIDDINMPVFNDWGDQITNEIVRQLMEMKGIYSLDKPGEFNYILDIQFIAAMIHPGGGRNDIPHRLKRQFCIFNCTLPSNSSMDKIFDVIGMGYFCSSRFNEEIVDAIPSMVPLTRILWQKTKGKMLPTPAKFHYIFNLRDLSRIWEGMLRVVKRDCDSIKSLLSLWKHECTRVIADRFINEDDNIWFNKNIHATVSEVLGDQFEELLPPEPLWVSFMLDPDDMIEQGRLAEEDDLPDFPYVYQVIPSMDHVKDRLKNFQEQYNETVRGAKLDLVFFRDAILHILRITRIIRTDRGCAMLVGVGGSGKQSLTKLSSFLSGYTTFQITLTRAYTTSNLMEDLKGLYKLSGQKGKGVSFIFTDNDIKEEGFLEYFNNMLSSGEIANLLAKDEVDEVCNELIMPMKKEFGKREPTMDNLYAYFISRVRKNLHVVLCFSPVGPKFRSRALKFPGLVSGCTIDWFSRWPRDALIAVSKHFISSFPIVCPGDTKYQVIDLMATIHEQVFATCIEYFDRFRRQTHVTPKSYLSFIHGYKQIYRERRKNFELLSKRMDTGLVKLQEAAVQVAGLSKELVVMEAHLAVASAEAEVVLKEVTKVAESAQKVKDEVKQVKDGAEELVKLINSEKLKAEGKLEEAKPALDAAARALQTINTQDIATVRKLGTPPHLIMRVLDCVMVLFYGKLDPYVVDMAKDSGGIRGNCPKPSWAQAIRFMSSNFLQMLVQIDKDSINGEHRDLMEPIFFMEDYNHAKAEKISTSIAGLLDWTRALAAYYGVNKHVLPLKMNLAQSEGKLAKANAKLEKAQETLGVKEIELGAAQSLYEGQMKKRQVVVDEAMRCKRKMTLASDLINGLAGERERWTEQSKAFKSQIIRLTGDVVLCTGFLSYTGPFNQEYRSNLLSNWKGELKRRRIPSSLDLNLINMLIEPHIVGEWNLHGLPNDELSIQNGIIVNKGPRYPLLIDPQVQGKAWLKSLEKANKLKITSQNHKYFRSHLEETLSNGIPLLIEDIGEELDPILDNVLEKNFIKAGTLLKVKLGDSEVEVLPGFRLYLTTKLPNPFYTPEISARTLIIDFTVTMRGLEDQLLGRVISTEKEELEGERVALVEGVTANRRKMAELEENLLYKLSSIQGSLLDDESIVEVLNTTKTTAIDVKEKLFVAAETEKKINVAREEFRPVATRGSILYFLICDMVMVNSMYQTSLNQFLEIFDSSMHNSEKTPHVQKRIHHIIEYLTYAVFKYSCRGFYEQHKFMFTLLMALKIDIQKGIIKFTEFQTLIKGGGALDLNAVAPKPNAWMTDVTWLNLIELSNLPRFATIPQQVSKNERFWKTWFDKDAPEDEHIPDGYSNIDPFYRLLLIRSWCPDRVISQAKKYIASSLGQRFASPVVLNMDELYQESRPKAPCCCFLSMGSDPTPQIEALAKRLHVQCRSISMGQGQEVHARALLSNFMANGGWVLLQNCHLGLEFMVELLDIILDYESPHTSFRLWITTEAHIKFPISLLQTCIKFTNDPPQGVKAGLKRTYTSITSDTIEYTNAVQWRPMLYAISFLHSVVQERRKYGALGWNIPYEFGWNDWAACVQFFQTHLDEIDPKKGVSWVTIRYLVGEVHYGGRVTDDYDKRLLGTFCRIWLGDPILQDGFQFSEGYSIPRLKTVDDYIKYIEESLTNNEQPGVYGLHRNAGITYQSNTAKAMLDTILDIQPKDSSGGGGETRESIVYRQATEFLDKLPPPFLPHRIKERVAEMGGLTPMNIFLRQEIDRMQKVLKVVRSTLTDLRLAIDGTIIMNEALRDALDSIFDAKVPLMWKKVSWMSTTIGFWFTELLERNAQFVKWLNKGRPNSFWMTGFFNPQGFITAMKQEVTRAHKGWSLDQVAIHNEVLKQSREELGNAAPNEGVYIYGLFIEGAGWDKNSCKIIESSPKTLFVQMPVIHVYASDNIKPKDSALYECPVYKKPGRTGLNFISPLWLKSNYPPEHWILRGVALLCDVK